MTFLLEDKLNYMSEYLIKTKITGNNPKLYLDVVKTYFNHCPKESFRVIGHFVGLKKITVDLYEVALSIEGEHDYKYRNYFQMVSTLNFRVDARIFNHFVYFNGWHMPQTVLVEISKNEPHNIIGMINFFRMLEEIDSAGSGSHTPLLQPDEILYLGFRYKLMDKIDRSGVNRNDFYSRYGKKNFYQWNDMELQEFHKYLQNKSGFKFL